MRKCDFKKVLGRGIRTIIDLANAAKSTPFFYRNDFFDIKIIKFC